MNVISNRLTNRELRLSTADQVTSSLSNLVFIVLIAQTSSSEIFARISTIWIVISFAVVIARSTFGVPLLLDSRLDFTPDLDAISGARLGSVLISLPVLMGSAGFFLFTDDVSLTLVLILAACIPLILMQDFGRYLAISMGRSKDALASDLVLLAPLGIASALTIFDFLLLSTEAVVAVLLSGLIVSMFMLRRYGVINVSFRQFKVVILTDLIRRKKLLQESAINALTAVATVAAVWIAYDSLAVASFNGALYALSPITFSVLIVNLVLQQSVSKSHGAIPRRDYAVFGALLSAALFWGILVTKLPDKMGNALLGVSWNLIQPLVIPMSAMLCLTLVLEFVLMVFRARGQFSLIVSIRTLLSIATPSIYLVSGLIGYSLENALYIVAATLFFLVAGLYIRSKSYFLA